MTVSSLILQNVIAFLPHAYVILWGNVYGRTLLSVPGALSQRRSVGSDWQRLHLASNDSLARVASRLTVHSLSCLLQQLVGRRWRHHHHHCDNPIPSSHLIRAGNPGSRVGFASSTPPAGQYIPCCHCLCCSVHRWGRKRGRDDENEAPCRRPGRPHGNRCNDARRLGNGNDGAWR